MSNLSQQEQVYLANKASREDTFQPAEPDVATGLPVAGYKPTQPQWAIDLVNENKILEERVLRQIDTINMINRSVPDDPIDSRAVALARTKIQEAFMWLNRAIFRPQRIDGDL